MRLKNVSKILVVAVLAVSAVSCDEKPKSGLEILTNEALLVVPGSAPNCTDVRGSTSTPIPQSLGADFFRLSLLKFSWNGGSTGAKELYIAAIKFEFAHAYLQSSPVEKTLSGTDLTYAFFNRDTDQPITAGTTTDMNSFGAAFRCGIGVGGIKRVTGHESTSFSTIAKMTFIGYAQNTDGSEQEPVRASTHIRLDFF